MTHRIWDLYSELAARVRKSHEEAGLVGHHDWIHAFRVGEQAMQIVMAEWGSVRNANLAGIAGLCHNADRICQKTGSEDPSDLVREWIGASLDYPSTNIIVDAVSKHSDVNDDDELEVAIALKDADRVVNLDVDLFIRSGQHYANLPAVDYRNMLDDPEASYREPKSVLRDIAYSLDWVNPDSDVCIRTKEGMARGRRRAEVFQTFFEHLTAQLEEEGVHPYHFS
ncbi:MAG: hypothetical protein HOG89_03515 [Candidatus Peribacter sp.]|jgi:hypothetical protein|nr:hypothetical protein [Candidatus Peribacter sp.]MBT4393138.1 hypothetical protein [Candidatus Peribacter sp.]MBT4600518.1 hypothetical protein [Candidatus Peribacter sp.]MBT5148506.1 hypothetical protein [Candidatus Peribacter sp.]MBT5638673.1 hypothetical protein [Candidatus Peribacter sp.]